MAPALRTEPLPLSVPQLATLWLNSKVGAGCHPRGIPPGRLLWKVRKFVFSVSTITMSFETNLVPLSGRYLVNAVLSVGYGAGEPSTITRNSARTTWRMRAAVDLGTPGMSRTVASGFSNKASPTARLAPK